MALLPDMVGIVARDMERSLAFYRTLGLEIPMGNEGEPYVEVITPNGYRISWNSEEMVRGMDPDFRPGGSNRISLAYKCDSPTEVDATYERMIAAGFRGHREPWDAFWGQRYAVLLDPDENTVDIFAPLPSDETAA
ncbi:MAG: VOC family protein [Capsulimonadales bacterium]|nr:VOC family protein [Capsulimonadales bacterium]